MHIIIYRSIFPVCHTLNIKFLMSASHAELDLGGAP